MTDYKQLVEGITTRTSMYVINADYFSFCNYLLGYDAGGNGAFLGGFHEWLCVKFDSSWNVIWSVAVASTILGDNFRSSEPKLEFDTETNQKLISNLRTLMIEFLELRDKVGVRNIYYEHGVWQRSKSWFDENVNEGGVSDGKKE